MGVISKQITVIPNPELQPMGFGIFPTETTMKGDHVKLPRSALWPSF